MLFDDTQGQWLCHLRCVLVLCPDELGCAAIVLVVKSTAAQGDLLP
jgi:hypothetical protein